MGCSLVEGLRSNLLELEGAHHRVEEDLKEIHVILVGLLHHLHPLNFDLVLGVIVLRLELRQLGDLLQGEDAEPPVDVELKVLLDWVAALLEDVLAHRTRVVGDFGVELHRVLVDTFDVVGVKINREVVTEELQFSALGASSASWFLGKGGGC